MKDVSARWVEFAAGLLALLTLGSILAGQAASPERLAPIQKGVPTDWTHRHVIFSQPFTEAQAAAVLNDPRYWQQWNRDHLFRALAPDANLNSGGRFGIRDFSSLDAGADWSQNLGSGANAGAGTYPAKFSFQITTATCASGSTPDYVVFSTGLLGSSSQASIVGYDNLYSGCSGIVPTVYWAYNTAGQVLTSPVISGDGKQVAFVQSNGGFGILVLLKWAASTTETVNSPMTLTPVSNGAYRACAAPCMTTVLLKDGLGVQTDDTTSSVFPDYTKDIIWVGGARGWLHKISGVFRGKPAEVTTGGFPVQVKPSNPTALSSPVYGTASGNVFVADYGGFFYRVSSTGVATASGQIDFGAGLVSGPIVDSTAGKAYVFSSSDGTTNCVGLTPCSAVYMFATNFAAGTTGSNAVVGASKSAPPNPNPLFEGGFDSKYLASVNATGNLYVCGNTGGPPILYQIPINAGVLGTVVSGPVLSNATTGCSPVTDISNPNATGGTTEWIFAGVQASGLGNSCASGGCVMNYENTPWIASHAYAVGQQVLDTHFQVQTCRTAGTSRAATPGWSTTVGASTTDNSVRWVNQGPQVAAHGAWQPSHAYALATSIIDSNGNIQVVTTAGTSRTVVQGHPAWSPNINVITNDNTVRWRNTGLPATASLAAAGGASGIIIDNTVGSGTLAGTSQIYFTTQSNQVCGSSGTGGCAVQASQSALQ